MTYKMYLLDIGLNLRGEPRRLLLAPTKYNLAEVPLAFHALTPAPSRSKSETGVCLLYIWSSKRAKCGPECRKRQNYRIL
jgi:hypothetical protein